MKGRWENLSCRPFFKNFVACAALWHRVRVILHRKPIRNTMKLSEALSLRADLQRKIGQLKRRLCSCVKVQEGNDPIEDPVELRKELDRCFEQLEGLVYRINYTNLVTERNGVSITKMIAQRDTLTLRVAVMREVLKYASDIERYGHNEFRYLRMIDVAKMQQETDECANRRRKLDMEIQGINWIVDLL